MNPSRLLFHSLLLLLLPALAPAQTPAPPPAGAPLAPTEVASTLPGVIYEINKIVRLDDTHVLVGVNVKTTASMTGEAMIGEPAEMKKPARALTEKEAASGKYDTKAFSLASAVIADGQTLAQFKAYPVAPSLGPTRVIIRLNAASSIQMAVCFRGPPPPPPGPDGRVPQQKIMLALPKASKVLMGLVVPPAQPASTVQPSTPAATPARR